jgi:hypothetical protein
VKDGTESFLTDYFQLATVLVQETRYPLLERCEVVDVIVWKGAAGLVLNFPIRREEAVLLLRIV